MEATHEQLEVMYNDDTKDAIKFKLLNIRYIKLFKQMIIGLFSYYLILIIKCKEFKSIVNNLYFELTYNKNFVNQMWVTTFLRKDSFKSFVTRLLNKFGYKNVDHKNTDNNLPNKILSIANTEECVTFPEVTEETDVIIEDSTAFDDDENHRDNNDFDSTNIDENVSKIEEVDEHPVERKKSAEKRVRFSDKVLLYYIY